MLDAAGPMPAVRLCADGLLLRPYRPDDAPALCAAVQESLSSVGRWLPWCHAGYSEADGAAWIAHCAEAWAQGEMYTFAIFDDVGAEFLGAAGLTRANDLAAIGYWVREAKRGRGIAARAGRHIAAFGFGHLGLARIEILSAVDNHASRRTAERIGARFEGIARSRLAAPQGRVDAAVYTLIRSDYAEAQIRAISS